MKNTDPDLEIQRMTFEEIAEFHDLNLEDIQVTGTSEVVILVYDPNTNLFSHLKLDGLNGNVVTTAVLSADIMATEPWVKSKDFKAGMNMQQVMEQLLTPKAAGTATLSVGPMVFKAFKDTPMTATVNYTPETDGAILGATGTFEGTQVGFTVSGNTASSNFGTGPVSINSGQHEEAVTINVALQIEDRINGGTRIINMSKDAVAVSEVVHGIYDTNDAAAIEALAQAGLTGALNTEVKAMAPKRGSTVHVDPIPSNVPVFYWFVSTRTLLGWEQKDFAINHGDVVDTYDVTDIILNGINYKLYIFKTKTAFDAVTLIFK